MTVAQEMQQLERVDRLMVWVVLPVIAGVGIGSWVFFLLYEAMRKL